MKLKTSLAIESEYLNLGGAISQRATSRHHESREHVFCLDTQSHLSQIPSISNKTARGPMNSAAKNVRLCEWITNEAKKRRSTATPRNGCRTPGFQPPFLLEVRGNKCTLPRSVPGAASHGHFRSEPRGPAQPVKQAPKVPGRIISPSSLFSILQGVYTDPNNPDRCRCITHRSPSASVADRPA
ncbi:hypothetical protein FALCPG4_004784 [Fusarium falciforme]